MTPVHSSSRAGKEETLEAEAFQEPPGSLADHIGHNSYRVPLISQEKAYANHGSQVNQVTAVDGGYPSTRGSTLGAAREGPEARPLPSSSGARRRPEVGPLPGGHW